MFEDISWDKEESWGGYMYRTRSEVYGPRSEVYEYVLSELTTGEKVKQSETSIKISSEERIQPTSAPPLACANIHNETEALQQTPGTPAESLMSPQPGRNVTAQESQSSPHSDVSRSPPLPR